MERIESSEQFNLGFMLSQRHTDMLLQLCDATDLEPYELIQNAIEVMWRVEVDD